MVSRLPGGSTESTKSSWASESTIRVTFAASSGERPRRSIPARVGGGIADQDVVHGVHGLGEPQRFGERVREHPGEARQREDGFDHAAHPDRFGGHANRRADRASEQLVRVVPEGIEVQGGDGRFEPGGRGSEARPVRLGGQPGRGIRPD